LGKALFQLPPPNRACTAHAQRPIRVLIGRLHQAVALPFFRRFSGSGLVIHCLVRFQPTPRRLSVWRNVSSLTQVGLTPWATLTSAAQANVHRLPGLPNSRGLRCNRARNCSARSPANACGRTRWGRVEPAARLAARAR